MNKIICLKWGDKYGVEYVNNLYSMVERNMSLPFEFVCYTDNPSGIREEVNVRAIPVVGLDGWWNKLALFTIADSSRCLFLDLDVVISGSLDEYFTYKPEESFLGVSDFLFPERTMNSSVFRWIPSEHHYVYEEYIRIKTKEPMSNGKMKINGKVYNGDQEWISDCVMGWKGKTFPKEWTLSFKKNLGGERSPPPDSKIVVFHGSPNPHEVTTGWVKRMWK